MRGAEAILAGAFFLAASAAGAEEPRSWREINEQWSGVQEPMIMVVRDAQTWKALWDRHERVRRPPRPAPAVDFRREMVVGVFLGLRSGGGYSVELQIEDKGPGAALLVKYQETAPGPDDVGVTSLTQPCLLRKLPIGRASVKFERLPVKTRQSKEGRPDPQFGAQGL